ncbi:MAG: hypothetical protein WKF47_11785 [Geodermatophilaceae bacterium]
MSSQNASSRDDIRTRDSGTAVALGAIAVRPMPVPVPVRGL